MGDHLVLCTFEYSIVRWQQKVSFINCYDIIDASAHSDHPSVSDSGTANVENFQPAIISTNQQFMTLP
jgi:hypothetical protein